MNSVNSKIATLFTKKVSVVALLLMTLSAHAWEVDLSRRQVDFKNIKNNNRLPASTRESSSLDFLTGAMEVTEPVQEIVIMNTEKGFVPQTLKLKKNGNYKIHIVNVNSKEKNISFILDAFSEHHNTIYGETKSFSISPKVDGIYSFLSPETGTQGKIIIFSDSDRLPASQ
ncbi:MAG: cupredoxin domain-containing protein [Bdellovibrionia bacterium]